jgi:glycosyltransferase involved in cell wall biosynthesis
MKVAIVHHQLARGGGMERYLLDLVGGFRAAGDAVEVFARHVDESLAATLGAPVHRLKAFALPRVLRQSLLAREIQSLDLRARFDLSLTLTRAAGADIYICGGTHPQYLESMGQASGWRDRLEIGCERSAVAQSALCVAHSRGLAGELQRHYGVAAERCRVLYPPVDLERFRTREPAERARLRVQLGLPANQRLFLFPSMGHARKGFDLLAGACAALTGQPLTLLVAGRRAGGALPGNVRELGYVEDMAALYAAVDWSILPSRYEPFGLALAESLACGTPVIASRCSGLAELIGPQDGIVVDALSVDGVREAMLRACATTLAPTDFAERNGLLLARHIDALRALKPQI